MFSEACTSFQMELDHAQEKQLRLVIVILSDLVHSLRHVVTMTGGC